MERRRIGLALALIFGVAPLFGCTQLQRTSVRASRLIDPIRGRRPVEPGLDAPAGTPPWAEAASQGMADDPGTFALAGEPPGTVPAIGRTRSASLEPDDGARSARSSKSKKRTKPKGTTAKKPRPAQVDPLDLIDRRVADAQSRLDDAATYRVRMTRQERVGDRLLPEEVVILNIRREPLGVRLEWPDGPNKGREVLYSEQECGGMMQVRLGGPIPVPPLKLAPDSPLAMQNSRHPINEAGLDPILNDLRAQVDALRRGDQSPGKMTLDGDRIKRVDGEGTVWLVEFDPRSKLPKSVRQEDSSGQLIESYQFEDLETDVAELATTAAFDPAERWPSGAGGFLGRLARAAQGDSENGSDAPKDAPP